MASKQQPAPTDRDATGENGTQSRWLAAMRVAWVVLAGVTVGIFAVSVPALVQQLQIACTAEPCPGWQLAAGDMQALQSQNISAGFYAAYAIGLNVVLVLAFLGVAALIMWHRGRDRAAVLMALTLTLFAAGDILGFLGTVWHLPDAAGYTLLGTASALLVYLFPNGKFVPRWTRWMVLFVFAMNAGGLVLPEWNNALSGIASLVSYPTSIAAQVYRYRRVSTPKEREQTKWAVFGIALVITVQATIGLIGGLVLQTSQGAVYLAVNAVWPLSYSLIPVSIGIAILRSRLYDIDIIIRRTLVYGALTAVLAAVYAGSIVALQTLLRPVLGENNDLAVVISTLAIAALFLPLRRRIQAFIDKRFYRRKYDAAKTLEAFSATLRDEVDIDTLTARLLAVVDETMQPAQIWLWLRSK